MVNKITLIALFATISLSLFSQRPTMELNFTAENNGVYVQLDSIKIMNRTQGGESMIYWPDTTLSLEINPGDLLQYVGYTTFSTEGVSEVNDDISSLIIYQNYPNPMGEQSDISLYINHSGKVHLMITDLLGRVVLQTDQQLDGGHHSFRFHSGDGNFYFLTVYWNGESRSMQMISTGRQESRNCRLYYVGSQSEEPVLKNSLQVNDFIVRQSGILDSPDESTTYTFQFATNIPCPGIPTVEYAGKVYHTIQIFSQCWLKENLNVGTMVESTMQQSNNGTVEKYCFNNDLNICSSDGGLYQWNEMMQYSTQQGARGICPPGWHLPADEEWKVLQGGVDSQHGIGDPEWDSYWAWRGYDAGTNLKTTSGWYGSGNGTDLFGFSGLPGGFRDSNGSFYNYDIGYWWSSTEDDNKAVSRCLSYGSAQVGFYNFVKGIGFNVRCLRDY
jgi:uncharacterized protein (TIGR02145 family)